MDTEVFKDGFDGLRGSPRLTGPERQALRLGRADLVQRLHDAVLCLSVQKVGGPAQMRSGSPAYIVEFSDRVGEEVAAPPSTRFAPTAAQVTDMPRALQLLDGLRRHFYKVLLLRALHDFAKANGEDSDWTWKKIGAYFGFSESWAEGVYDAAIVQAARRSGLLPAVSKDHGLVVVGVWSNRAWLTNISTAADPRQAVANLRGKSPLRLETAFAIWVAGPPVAKRILDEARPQLRSLLSHGSWYKAHPDIIGDMLRDRARAINADWLIEDIQTEGALAA